MGFIGPFGKAVTHSHEVSLGPARVDPWNCPICGPIAGVAGSSINFNGTAGVWRRSVIDDAGGWRHDISSRLRWRIKVEATFHLTANFAYPLMVLLAC